MSPPGPARNKIKNHVAALSPADGLAKLKFWTKCLGNPYVSARKWAGNKIRNHVVDPRPAWEINKKSCRRLARQANKMKDHVAGLPAGRGWGLAAT